MSQMDLSIAPPEEQMRILQEGLGRVKAHAFHMRKSLDADRIMESVKHALEMVAELRIGALTPKNYYELYMLAFDNLRYMASVLTDAHRAGRCNLAELYELVQYSATIVPRLYMMITVGSAYMPIGETPIRVILRDLIDMSRGVQHPVRGLFLRHYLSSMTKDYLPESAPPVFDSAPPSPVLGPEDPAAESAAAAAVPAPASPDADAAADASAAVLPVDDAGAAATTSGDAAVSAAAPATSQLESVPTSPATQSPPTLPPPPYATGTAIPERSPTFHGTVDDSIGFVMQNFVEMNKLWVRLQHQGSLKDRERREAERRELRILVGTNIVRLSQLEAVDLRMYKTKILPPILDQIINCRDVIAQEYLMEVIIQVFPDSFHLRALEPILAVTAQLQAQVNIKTIIVALIDRLRAFAAERQSAAAAAAAAAGTATAAAGAEEEEDGIPENLHLFDVFWGQITQVITARPDLGIMDISSLLLSLIQLSVACYPDQIAYVDQILRFAREQVLKVVGTSELGQAATVANFQALLLAPLQQPIGVAGINSAGSPARSIMWILQLPNDAQAFRELLAMQPYTTRHAVALFMVTHLVRQRAQIDAENHLVALVECIQVMVKDQKDGPLWKNTGLFVEREALGNLHAGYRTGSASAGAAGLAAEEAEKRREQLDELALEQSQVAKFVSLIYHPDTGVHAQLLSVARKYLAEGGGFRLKHTFPALLYQAVRVIDRIAIKHAAAGTEIGTTMAPGARETELMNMFKYVHQVVTAVQHKSDDVVLATQLFLVAARAADRVVLEEIAYEFFVSALTVYEECINDSRVQFTTLTSIVNTLLECTVFAVDNYDTLSTKCTLHASRLLKRPDQCRAVVQCSHLFWPAAPTSRLEYRDAKRVLECLQKALKFADACLDSVMNVELLVETLVRYIYFYEKGCPLVAVKHINGLLELIATNLANLQDAARAGDNEPLINGNNINLYRGFSASSLVGLDVGGGSSAVAGAVAAGGGAAGINNLHAVASHFRRTCAMLVDRKSNPPKTLGEGPLYNEIVVPQVSQ
ncbi:retromer complex subunit Vps35 [Blastocladiella emersonii ATCC 22665]|nr:retromer complex subunit Vps35 [Blastocladiella emersonii ATCC 22665]